MKRTMKSAIACATLIVSVGLSGCSRPATNDAGGDSADQTIRLAAGVDPSYTPVYVAASQGYFEDQGVDVEYVTTGGGPTMTQAVTAGEADMAVQSDTTATSLMANDPDLRALGVFEHSQTYIKTTLGEGVEGPEDIEKMATLPGLFELLTVRYLESNDIDPDSVEMVEVAPADIPTVLSRGDVDATVIFEPWATRAANQSGGRVTGNIGDFGMNYSQWLVTSSDWLSNNEEDAAKVLRALKQANEFIKANPQEAAEITEEAIEADPELTQTIMKELVFEVRDLSEEDVEAMRAAAEFFEESGNIAEVPDLEKQLLVGWWSEHKS